MSAKHVKTVLIKTASKERINKSKEKILTEYYNLNWSLFKSSLVVGLLDLLL